MSDVTVTRRDFLSATGAAIAVAGAELSRSEPTPLPPVVVGCAPAAALASAHTAGVAAVLVPVITTEHFADAMRRWLEFRRLMNTHSARAFIAERPGDLAAARRRGRVAVIAHSHGLQWMDRDLDVAGEFVAAGLRVAKLSSGWRNLLADGCCEATDLGLTRFGRRAVPLLEQSGLLLDLAYTGRRSTLEAMDRVSHPVVFSHVNAAAVHAHPFNLTDDQIRACAKTGGVIGVSAFPDLVGGKLGAADVVRHIDHIAGLVGVEHVGLGLDFAATRVRRFPTDPISDPPHGYPTGLAGFADIGGFTARLASAGYDAPARAAILGGNFSRVLGRVLR